jgi:transitional endoplasmic reticulum ATPase
MKKLEVETADVVKIIGKKQSAGIVWPSYPQDRGKGIVRINSRIQKNTNTKVGDLLEIRKTKFEIARSIILIPVDVVLRDLPHSQFERFVKKKIYNMPITLNDYISVPMGISRFMYLKVINLQPKGICLITNETTPNVINIIKSYTHKTHKS